jgi:hypothetical protein
MKTAISFLAFLAFSVAVAVSSASADQIMLLDGDVLNGKVLAMTTNSLVLQDGSLGTLTLPRDKVSNITLGAVAAALPPLVSANTPASQANSLSDLRPLGTLGLQGQASLAPAGAGTPSAGQTSSQLNSSSDLQAIAHEIGEHSNLVQEVEAQVMGSSASPEAANKFNELVNELSSGQLDMNGLRSQAQSAADQLQEYKKEMGPDAGKEVDGYLTILNGFLRETAPTNGASP